jgi:hypothetical protein
VLHAVLLAILLASSFHPWWFDAWNARQSRTIYVSMADGQDSPDDKQEDPSVRIVTSPAEVTPEMVRQRLDEIVAEEEETDDEQSLDRLDQLSDRLNQLSDEDSVDAMADAMQSLLGTSPRAVHPAGEAAEGPFDFDTAQFHDVKRTPNDSGGYTYVTVLLDAGGRTIEVVLDPQEGERAFQTMQRIGANPLLDQVYRQIAMPLLDQILAGVKQTAASGSLESRSADAARGTRGGPSVVGGPPDPPHAPTAGLPAQNATNPRTSSVSSGS